MEIQLAATVSLAHPTPIASNDDIH
jgi:hypothetical protein